MRFLALRLRNEKQVTILNEGEAHLLKFWRRYLSNLIGFDELILESVKAMKEMRYCRVYQQFWDGGQCGNCGKNCIDYKPRNRKAGICIHNFPAYEGTGEYRLLRKGRKKTFRLNMIYGGIMNGRS